MDDKNLELIPDKEETLFEMLDYSALTMEMFFFALAIVTTLITAIGYGGLFEAFEKYSYLGYISIMYLYTRGIKFLYRFFSLKEYKLIFHKDKIIQTSTKKTFFLNTIEGAYNISMYFSSQYNSNKTSKIKYFISYIIIIIGFPLSFPFAIILVFVKVLPILIIKKSFNISSYSLVLTFPEQRAVNIPYGVLHEKDIEFLENYFKDYFELQKLQKAFLYVPNNVKGKTLE